MNNVSKYGILTRRKSLSTHLVLFSLLYSPVVVSIMTPEQWQANIFGIHFPMYIFSVFGKYPDGTFRHVHRRRLPCFQEEILVEKQKIKFQLRVKPHNTVRWN